MASNERERGINISNEWEVFFEDVGLTLKFTDYSDPAFAYTSGFKPGYYIKAFPILHENILDKAFMEQLMDEIAEEITNRITAGKGTSKGNPLDFGLDLTSGESFIMEMEKYSHETGIANLRVYQVTPQEFEKETDGLTLLMPSKNDLPL